jgi:dTDP-4-dehydrorhamnose reductase
MLKLAAQGKPLTIVHDQRCTPSYTVDVAAGTVQLLQTVKYGLYHLTNAGDCSWFEFANAIFGLADVQAVVKPITTKEFGRKAARPVYSVLTSEFKWTPKLRPWREGLSAYLQEKKMAGSA